MTDAVAALAPAPGMTAAICASLGVSRATVQRKRARLSAPPAIARPRPRPVRALNDPQRQQVLDVLRAPRFADQAPAEIYAALLDEGVYHCSIRTMYRILDDNNEVRERRQLVICPVFVAREVSGRMDLQERRISWTGHAFTKGYRNVSTTLIHPGLEFKLVRSASIERLVMGKIGWRHRVEPVRSMIEPSSCLGPRGVK